MQAEGQHDQEVVALALMPLAIAAPESVRRKCRGKGVSSGRARARKQKPSPGSSTASESFSSSRSSERSTSSARSCSFSSSASSTVSPPSEPQPPDLSSVLPSDVREQLVLQGEMLLLRKKGGGSKLRRACREGMLDTVQKLIAAGAPIHAIDEAFGRSPLHYAASHGQADCVQLLLALGADPEQLDLQHQTPIHLAAERGHAHVIETLTSRGGIASVGRVTSNGSLALHFAVSGNHTAAVSALLRAMRTRGQLVDQCQTRAFVHTDGAHAVRGRSGLTPAELARIKGFDELARMIDTSVDAAMSMEKQARSRESMRRAIMALSDRHLRVAWNTWTANAADIAAATALRALRKQAKDKVTKELKKYGFPYACKEEDA